MEGLSLLGPWFPPRTLVANMVVGGCWEDVESEEKMEELKEIDLLWGINEKG